MKQEIKEYICPFCCEKFICNRNKFSYHKKTCIKNPNYEYNLEKIKKSKELRHQKFIDEQKKFIHTYELKCKKCGKIYFKKIHERDYNRETYSHFCSKKCANTHIISDETKQKISEGLRKSERYKRVAEKRKQKLKYKNEHTYYCGTKELNEQNVEISKRQSPKYFNKFIPFGLDISKLYTCEFVNEYYKVKQILYKEYVINGLSPADIYKKYNCEQYIKNSETLLHVFKDMNFPIRSHKAAASNAWVQGKFEILDGFQYKQQWHTTWNNKEVYLHSSYELDYAKELDEQNIDYEVENLRIKYLNTKDNEYHCAIPDFYLKDTNTIVEIKSTWTLDIQNMKDKFEAYKEHGYNCKLILDHKETDLYSL